MSWEMTVDGKDALVRILPSCGGTMSTMWHLAEMIRKSKSLDLTEILGDLLIHLDSKALQEVAATCSRVNGIIDLVGVVSHFAGYEHLHKFDTEQTVVAVELPEEMRAVAHTLLPLTMVGGEYRYENGDIHLPISGLVEIGKAGGTPYAHLASVIWLDDKGYGIKVLTDQLANGVAARAAQLKTLDYAQAPKLRAATQKAAKALGL